MREGKDEFVQFLFELEKRRTLQPKCPPSGCRCECCFRSQEKVQADISLNRDLVEMQRLYSHSPSKKCSFVEFVELVRSEPSNLPNFPILDTVTFAGGRPHTLLYWQDRLRINTQPTPHLLKSFLLTRKLASDIEYLKEEYRREHPDFIFILLDHNSEKLLKSFEKQLKEVHPSQRRICSVQWRGRDTLEVLNQVEFEALLEGRKLSGGLTLTEVEYLQLFPTIPNEEQHERTDRVYYFRQRSLSHPHYLIAEQFYSVWGGRNLTLQELETQFMAQLQLPQEYLFYVACKLAIHVQYSYNCRLQSFMAEFLRDKHGNIRLKNIRYLRSIKKVGLYVKENRFSSQRTIPESEHIQLREHMAWEFKQFQEKFKAVYANEIDQMTLTIIDTERSQQTFKQLTGSTADFEELLRSRNSPAKKRQLGID